MRLPQRAYVYWNLHQDLYSVRKRGKVRRHTNYVQLRNVTFSVSQAGRDRVLREKRKNVHAGIRGEDCCTEPAWQTRGWRRVIYDPYRFDSFVTATGHKALSGAQEVVGVVVEGRPRVYARGLEYA